MQAIVIHRVEGKKLATGACGPTTHDARVVIEQKAVRIPVENSVVALAVIGIITVCINLQQVLHILIGKLALMRFVRIKEISQRFLAISAVYGCSACGQIQHGIAVFAQL